MTLNDNITCDRCDDTGWVAVATPGEVDFNRGWVEVPCGDCEEGERNASQADDIEARMQERIDEQGDQDYFNSIDFQHDQDERED